MKESQNVKEKRQEWERLRDQYGNQDTRTRQARKEFLLAQAADYRRAS